MSRSLPLALIACILTLPSAHAAEKVTLDRLLRQLTDLSLLAEFPDPPYVAKQFSSYDRASEAPGQESWFANHDRGFTLYDGVLREKTPYFTAIPKPGHSPAGHFAAGTRVGIAPNRKPAGDHVWVYTTAPDGRPIDGKILQGYVRKGAITLDPQGHVLAEMDGPGCVVRIWSANPADAGRIRIYLDGAREPVIEAPLQALLGGKWQINQPGAPATGDNKWTPFPDPVAGERSRGYTLYFPIAYARHCKITIEKPDIYYHVDYRTYPKGTEVETFRLEALAEHRPQLKQVLQALSPPFTEPADPRHIRGQGSHLNPGDRMKMDFEGPGLVRRLQVRLDNASAETLRSLVLIGTFDHARQPQIWCPLGDFFASSPGVNPYRSLPFKVSRGMNVPRGLEKEIPALFQKAIYLDADWPMPFQTAAVFELVSLGKEKSVPVNLQVRWDKYHWTDRSMHFHAKWRTETMKTRPFRDWTYCDLRGKGVFVGDMLSLLNPVTAWWGEGDEKIYVDGEKFPSWFGTGTEDYYGYAWSDPKPFQHAYHNQTRCDGPITKGHTSVNRFHILDAIPFEKSFRFDMEIWHWTPNIDMTCAATSYWYALPGGTDDFRPVADKVLQNIPSLPPPYRVAGALEGEKLKILGKSEAYDLGSQPMSEFQDGKWSGDAQLWARPPKAGAWADLELPVPEAGKYEVIVYLTKARDYGIVQFHLGGKKLGKPIDGFEPEKVVATGPLSLGTVELKKGPAVLRVEVTGSNPRSVGLRTMWGLDCIVLKPVKP